jgi:hypothetical protein
MKEKSRKCTGQNEYRIHVIEDIRSIQDIRNSWKDMQWHPNADIDYFLLILKLRKEILKPYILVLSKDNIPITLLVGRVEEIRIQYKIGYKTIFAPKVRQLSFIYGGFMGDKSYIHTEMLISEVVNLLKMGEADVAFFNSLKVDSDIYHLTRAKPGIFCRDYILEISLHWKMTLPNLINEFYNKMSAKHRYWLRRMSRLLEKDYAGEIIFKYYQKKDQVDQLCIDAERIAEKTYQKEIGVGFIDNIEMRERLMLSADYGWLRGYLLYASGRPCAFWIGTLYHNICYLDYTGYDSDFQKYEPGTILFTKMIEDLCNHNIKTIDFGFGDALYKQRFGDENCKESSVYIYAPTLKGIVLNIKRILTTFIALCLSYIIKRMQLYNKIKKIWRKRLLSKPKKAD